MIAIEAQLLLLQTGLLQTASLSVQTSANATEETVSDTVLQRHQTWRTDVLRQAEDM